MPTPNDAHLFDDFAPASFEDWCREALKGPPLSSLARPTPEGFALDPIYTPHNTPPVLGRCTARAAGWVVCQEVRACDARAWNKIALQEVAGGVEGLVLALRRDPVLHNVEEVRQALADLDLSRVRLVLDAWERAPQVAGMLVHSGVPLSRATGSLGFDPVTRAATAQVGGDDPEPMVRLVRWCEEHPGFTALTCHGELYHDAGGNAVQELAFTLATGAQYLRDLVAGGIAPAVAADQIELSLAVGSRLLLEIAKLRAARLLWDAVVTAFVQAPGPRAQLRARSSHWSLSTYDPWVNLLRGTVQTVAAVVGGADRITMEPFDAVGSGGETVHARGLARNTQLILRDESMLGQVVDPAAGSWALEALSDRLGREAWALLQAVERRGGMRAAVEEGFPQGEVRRVAQQRRHAIATREVPFVGVSIYPDPTEQPRPDGLSHLAHPSPPVGHKRSAPHPSGAPPLRAREPDTSGLREWRAVEDFERLRHAADRQRATTGVAPRAQVVCWGEAPRVRTRMDWVANALRAGGFDVQGTVVYPTLDDALGHVGRAPAVIVVCAEDSAYAPALPSLLQRVPSAQVVVAGAPPPESPPWSDRVLFLHRGSDVVQVLTALQQSLGVLTPEVLAPEVLAPEVLA